VSGLIEHFDALHAADEDPWQVTSRWYERRKQALTLAALPRERYRRAFEPGCSIGALTEQLAPRCDHLLAMDAAPAAVERCRTRVSGSPEVDVVVGTLPDGWPGGPFDLVLLSEVAYYLDPHDVATTIDRCVSSLEPGGHLVAVHWREVADDFRTPGEDVHRAIAARPELIPVASYADADFLLDVVERR
jgi:trans-aconitate methyltransferase